MSFRLNSYGRAPAVRPGVGVMRSRHCGSTAGQCQGATGRQHSRMGTDDIAAIVTALGDLVTVVRQAEPADKAEIYGQLGLTLTYQLERRLVEATIKPGLNMRKGTVSKASGGINGDISLWNLPWRSARKGNTLVCRTLRGGCGP
jgi:hypothetical protein